VKQQRWGLLLPEVLPKASDDRRTRRGKIRLYNLIGSAEGGNLAMARMPDADRPRASTKRAVLIGMLERPEGASVAEIGQRLGWLPHTVRAAFTGLRHAGREVTRSKDAEGREALSRLPKLNIRELREEWCRLYKADASPHLSRALLIRAVAYRMQEVALGGLRPEPQRALST
jgi:hypothetical protein